MKANYKDILDKAGQPLWWDEHGAPRYAAFTPQSLSPYVEAVALMDIKCQHCSRPFTVASAINDKSMRMWRDYSDAVYARLKALSKIGLDVSHEEIAAVLEQRPDDIKKIVAPKAFSDDAGMFHYGDPPIHNCIGDTMNSVPVRVREFWERNNYLSRNASGLLRRPEHEVIIEHPSEPYEDLH